MTHSTWKSITYINIILYLLVVYTIFICCAKLISLLDVIWYFVNMIMFYFLFIYHGVYAEYWIKHKYVQIHCHSSFLLFSCTLITKERRSSIVFRFVLSIRAKQKRGSCILIHNKDAQAYSYHREIFLRYSAETHSHTLGSIHTSGYWSLWKLQYLVKTSH